MTPIRTAIVDDEPLARDALRAVLAADPAIAVVGDCIGVDAPALIERAQVELVFLDVQMPEVDGFQVLDALRPEALPAVVFVTAYDAYAVRAFEVHAVDYLLKPFDDARFDQAASRAHELIRLRTTDELRTQLVHLLAATDGRLAAHAPARFIERIAVREHKEIRIVAVSEIDYIAASGPYAEIHVAGEALLHRERMQSLEEVLDPARFCRIHRSAIVNLARVAAIEPQPSGDSSLRLCSGAVLRVSRARLAELNARLGIG